MEKISKNGFNGFIRALLKTKRLHQAVIVIAIDLVSTLTFAAIPPSLVNSSLGFIKPQPLAVAEVSMNDGFAAVRGDFLVPVSADFNHIFYGGLESHYSAHQNGSLFGLGMGYREITKPTQILGGYLFVSRNLTPERKQLWVANPGFKRLGETWDFRANAYIPVGTTEWVTKEGYGANIGEDEYTEFRGHTQFDRWVKEEEEAGLGGDIELGYHLPKVKGLSLYAGPYFYNFSNTNNLIGGAARIKYDLTNHISLLMIDSYDNHSDNVFTLAIRATLGGYEKNDRSLDTRLSDPVEHYVASRNQGTATPILHTSEASDVLTETEDDIFFIEPEDNHHKTTDNAAADGSYEHPYTGLNQTKIDAIYAVKNDARLYVKTGTYNLGGQLAVRDGMSMYGRSSDFKRTTDNDGRALLLGALALQGNNTIDSLRLQNSAGAQTTGIAITGTSATHVANIVLNDITVGAASATTGYATGMDLSYADNISLKNSSVYAYRQNSLSDTKGINSSNSDLTLNNSSVNATYSGTQALTTDDSKVYGIYVNGGTLNLTNGSSVTASATSSAEYDQSLRTKGIKSYGIAGSGKSKITVDDSTITAAATTSKNCLVTSYGLDIDDSTLTIQGSKSSVISSAKATGTDNLETAYAYGIDADTSSTLTLKNAAISTKATVNSTGGSTVNSYGIKLSNGSNATITGGTIEASSDTAQASAFGIYAEKSSQLTISGATIIAQAKTAARGIYANASTVTATNNKFNITASGAGISGWGYGIDMVGGTLTQSGNTFTRSSAMGQDVKQ